MNQIERERQAMRAWQRAYETARRQRLAVYILDRVIAAEILILFYFQWRNQ